MDHFAGVLLPVLRFARLTLTDMSRRRSPHKVGSACVPIKRHSRFCHGSLRALLAFLSSVAILLAASGIAVAAPAFTQSPPLANRAVLATMPAPSVQSPLVTSALQDLYVSARGSDDNPGTQTAPMRTIERASQAAAPGTTVHVGPGLYVGTIRTRKAGKPEARIRYIATERWAAQLRSGGKDAVWINHGNYIDIDGFDISGAGRIGILNLGSHTLIAHNHVHDMALIGGCTSEGGAGIDNGNYGGTDGDIIANIVHDIGIPGSCNGVHGIYSSNRGGRIVNNLVFRAASFGIHLWHAATHVTVANNTVFANGSSSMGGGIVLGNGNGPGGVFLDHTRVINNIVYDNPAASIKEFCYVGDDCIGPNNTFANNLVFNNGQPIALRRGRANNTIAADPQFVDYRSDGRGNYALRPTSPAIARAIPLIAAGRNSTPSNCAGRRKNNLGANIARAPVAPSALPASLSATSPLSQ